MKTRKINKNICQTTLNNFFQPSRVDPVPRPLPRRPGEHGLQVVGQEHQARPVQSEGGRGSF